MNTKIKTIRELRNFTQEHVARKMGKSQPAYSKIESGETNLDDNMKKALLQALEISENEFDNFDGKQVFNITNYNNQKVNSGVIHDYHDNQEYLKEMLKTKEESIQQL